VFGCVSQRGLCWCGVRGDDFACVCVTEDECVCIYVRHRGCVCVGEDVCM